MASTNSGITTDALTGERYIPSSVRPDGSKRREIKVRPGYRPPEDVELYKNRAAAAWRNRGSGGVPGAEGLSEASENKANTAASNKNAKRREAKKKAKAAQEFESTSTSTQANGQSVRDLENWRSGASAAEKKDSTAEAQPEVDPEAEKEKKARNLKKKLRQARDLRDKKNQGEALLPEQLEKVIKIQELIRQLDALGFDANGDKKDSTEEKEKEKEKEKEGA
ncbi:putative RNA binding protein Pym [Aspergillus fischeri NRRL 181]|uniref:RNA binding protein Pym, putative n=1 Tax=Neosartorya fischeri (strain ATCC 1020 / DSM 3700 / CBS 544.65 / FGSC A1164 / JCM 1740 / NRRL 181 / WB 181) TaxID=331117 RepID=A1DMP1_NEOFI|nr:RNA binding protein Pym, putative [Aspergillus fischeri NRRL 181]EAW16062.1 RNA binding protein Pym, putative [Aspergillus fischeri NRRL 181]KAG2025838.1 hypothetical protein GB937_002560 [Aspergillus fischeri]